MRHFLIAGFLFCCGPLCAQTEKNGCCEITIGITDQAAGTLGVTIANVNASSVTLEITVPERDFDVRVTAESGNDVARTERGSRLVGQPWQFRRDHKELKQGESITQTIDLRRLFDLKSGAYAISLTRRVRTRGGAVDGAPVPIKDTQVTGTTKISIP